MSAFPIVDTVPWGRDAAEYAAFFRLADDDRRRRILDCGGGPSSFAAERGYGVTAVDPLYRWQGEAIERRVVETAAVMREGVMAARARFVWNLYGSPEALVARRLATMRGFLADYAAGRRAGRYVAAALPRLPFPSDAFDLALCSHLLFLYDHVLDLDFHEAALLEMLRLAPEARIFPLLDMEGRPSKLVDPITRRLGELGLGVAVEPVDYEFQKDGSRMLRVRR